MRLRVCSYNIHGAVGRDRRHDVDRIADVLTEIAADVIALQEVASARGSDVLDRLAERTGLEPVAGATMLRPDGGSYGNALLVAGTVREVRRIDLSVPPHEPRGALDARIACRGASLRVVATHLGLFPYERRRQVRVLLGRIGSDQDRNASDEPLVLMGDVNEWLLWGRPLRWLHREFGAPRARATFPAHFPLLALDRLWVRPSSALHGLAVHQSPLARRASDHLPLVAEIDVANEA